MVDKLFDLMLPFQKKSYTTESLEGRYSIKRVLPTLCPDLSYGDLEIGDGMMASNIFLDLYYCDDVAEKQKQREALFEYCKMDTLAMVRVLEALKGV